MPSIGLDVHRNFCEVVIFEHGKVTRHPRVPSRWAALVACARSLDQNDQVGLEATGNALAIATDRAICRTSRCRQRRGYKWH
jgi:hypothetical protein